MATPIQSLFPLIEKKPFLLNKQKKREPSPDVVYRQNKILIKDPTLDREDIDFFFVNFFSLKI